MVDSDFEFVKIKHLLSKSPRTLQDDPIIGVDYLKVINLIKKKKLLEKTTNLYDPTAATEAFYHDVERQDRIAKIEAHQKME